MGMAMRGLAMVVAMALSFGIVTGAAGERTLKGSYHWTGGGKRGDLEAVFTPTSEGQWQVEFHFKFEGRPYMYAGTAEGTFAGGLKGRVLNGAGNRTFAFEGSLTEGVFQGTHAEIVDGSEQSTGTLTLKG